MFSDSDSDSEADFRRHRQFKERINFFGDDIETHARFRLTEQQLISLTERIRPIIEHPSRRNHALSPEQQVRLAIRFLATGADYKVVGDAHGVSKSTVCNTVHRFVNAVNDTLYFDVVQFPADCEAAVEGFRARANFPCVFGCVDGTHIEIFRPTINEEQFVNRHGRPSINTMIVCGPDYKIYFATARWPGAVSDARVFRNSQVAQRLRGGWRPAPGGVLLADSGYWNNDYLITPSLNPQNDQERRFNEAHKATRNIVECTIGILKQRLRCLLRPLQVQPLFAANIFRCCVVLHNLALQNGPPEGELEAFLRTEDSADDNQGDVQVDNNNRRNQIVQLF